MLLDIASVLAFIAVTVAPAGMLVLAVALLVVPQLGERRVHQIVGLSLGVALGAAALLILPLALGDGPIDVSVGRVVALRGFHIDLDFRVDGPGLVLLLLDLALCGTIGLFSSRYLHLDEGFRRFYLLLMVFAVGVEAIAVARGLDVLFAGWELVGLSSALLIAFFHRREAPVRHGLRAYAVYRVTDVGLLMGVVLLHHLAGTADLAEIDVRSLPVAAATLVGAFFIFGAMGKAASVPFTGWLPRAMEGPTPSSAIFYGALSIHASPFLLLRVQPLLDVHPGLRAAVVGVGLVTAAHASMVGRAQSDVKSGLGYASVAQVGLIWIWLGLGLETLALVHIAGHATLRTWQLLRAPSLLHDRHQVSSQLGRALPETGRHIERFMPATLQRRLYVLALERWYLDELLAGLVRLLTAPFRSLSGLDARVSAVLDGRAPGHARPTPDPRATLGAPGTEAP